MHGGVANRGVGRWFYFFSRLGKQTHVLISVTVILGKVVWKYRGRTKRGVVIVERRAAGLRTRIGLNGIGEQRCPEERRRGSGRFYRVGENAAGGLISRCSCSGGGGAWCGGFGLLCEWCVAVNGSRAAER